MNMLFLTHCIVNPCVNITHSMAALFIFFVLSDATNLVVVMHLKTTIMSLS